MPGTYEIKANNVIIRDEAFSGLKMTCLLVRDGLNEERQKGLDFHAEQDDYFGTLATVLNDLLQEEKSTGRLNKKTLASLLDDLEYMQSNFWLVKK